MSLIREANTQDIATIVSLIQELAENGGEASPIDEAYTAYFLQQSNCHVLLAEVDGQTVGLLSYMMKPDLSHASDTCYIAELVVMEGYRDQGVGSTLLDFLINRLRSQGCVEVSVSTMSNNQGAIQFYKKHGLVDEALLLERHFYR
jgi:ribosomal protein S18 acetylase RimI-like enzyme